jgi:hypothetical protein
MSSLLKWLSAHPDAAINERAFKLSSAVCIPVAVVVCLVWQPPLQTWPIVVGVGAAFAWVPTFILDELARCLVERQRRRGQ